MAHPRQVARKSMRSRPLANADAMAPLRQAIDDLHGTLAPRSDLAGSSPFIPALAPWLGWDPAPVSSWGPTHQDESQWMAFAQAISGVFREFKDPEHSRNLALAGYYGLPIVEGILDSFRYMHPYAEEGLIFLIDGLVAAIKSHIARQERAVGSFNTLLPADVLKIIIEFAADDPQTRVDLALVHPIWRNIALPVLWQYVVVDLNHDAEVKFFARVARGTLYSTRSFRNTSNRSQEGVDLPNICIDRAVLAVKGLRELVLTDTIVSMSVLESPGMEDLTDLYLHFVKFIGDPLHSSSGIPFHLRSLSILNGGFPEGILDALLTAITPGSSTTLVKLSTDSPTAVRSHLHSFARNLESLSLLDNDKGLAYLSSLDPATIYFPALRTLTLPRADLTSLLAVPFTGAPPDAPRSTISQTMPHLEHLILSFDEMDVAVEDLVTLDRLLRLPVCSALRTLELLAFELEEDLTTFGKEILVKILATCRERGLVVKVNGEYLC